MGTSLDSACIRKGARKGWKGTPGKRPPCPACGKPHRVAAPAEFRISFFENEETLVQTNCIDVPSHASSVIISLHVRCMNERRHCDFVCDNEKTLVQTNWIDVPSRLPSVITLSNVFKSMSLSQTCKPAEHTLVQPKALARRSPTPSTENKYDTCTSIITTSAIRVSCKKGQNRHACMSHATVLSYWRAGSANPNSTNQSASSCHSSLLRP